MLAFEWDPNKNESNRRKHDISFEEAEILFTKPHHIITSSHTGEIRFIAIA